MLQSTTFNRTLALCGAAMALSLGTPTALAQNAGSQPADGQPVDVRPPAPANVGNPSVMGPYAVFLLVAAGVLVLSIMPSQRTHQD
jgi:hypothetical protein